MLSKACAERPLEPKTAKALVIFSAIDTDYAVIVDVEATRSIRQVEVGSVRTMLDRVKDNFDLGLERIIAGTAYGSGPMLGWLVDRKIAPHIPVIDKASRV